ncbi:hypothetical protein [Filifactor alocis]|uniref:hypothetical protein n=1 Tax=Filifactor alocis TaxID=143361 RepID=UPI003F9F146D
MKKIYLLGFIFLLLSVYSFADSFTDAIQDLAMQTACVGQYSATQAGGGWYDDPHDYYTPQMLAERFAKMSGNMTRTTTFYGVCFDYAQFAYQDIEKYKPWYNEQGMYENKFWIAGTNENSNLTILQYPGTKSNHTTVQNGVYVVIPNGGERCVKTHKTLSGSRATHHAWVWIERTDGVQFWIDPTWTDNLGYVVYGYVKNGEEIQCCTSKDFCINYPSYLESLSLPPAMGQRKSPSKSANTTNRDEILQDSATTWGEVIAAAIVDTLIRKPFIDVDYTGMNDYLALIASAEIPFSSIFSNSISLDKMGFSLEMQYFHSSGAINLGFEYLHNLEDENNLHAGLFLLDFTRRLFNNVAWYIGGGAGLRFDFSNVYGASIKMEGIPDTGYFAWKADTGFIINIPHLFTKVEVSYNNVYGFSMGAGLGFGLEL